MRRNYTLLKVWTVVSAAIGCAGVAFILTYIAGKFLNVNPSVDISAAGQLLTLLSFVSFLLEWLWLYRLYSEERRTRHNVDSKN